MKIHCIGTGSAFSLKNYHTNFLIEESGKFLLIDCGSDIRFSLRDVGKSYKDIDSIYASHLHGDHFSGLEYMGFASHFDSSKDKISLYGNGDILQNGWTKTLSGGMESLQMSIANLDTYFDVKPIMANHSFEWQGIKCTPIQTVHIMNGFVTIPSFGLMLELSCGLKIYFTTDTQYAPAQMKDFISMSDLIFVDCECTSYKSGVHSHFSEWATFESSLKAKMLLCHYQDCVLTEDGKSINDEWRNKANENGFKLGFAQRGDVIDTDRFFIDVEQLR